MALLGLAACGGDDSDGNGGTPDPGGPQGPGPTVVRPAPAGEPRAFLMGLSNLPPELTTGGVFQAYTAAATAADIVLIRRAPPWREFLPGGQPSLDTQQRTRFETEIAEQYGLGIFFAIDPTDPAVERSRVINLPSSVDADRGFLDARLRDAFVAYTTYVALNYQPDYLAIGVEVNMMYTRNRAQFDAFVSLYAEAYTAARAASPGTIIFPTFQYEDLQGVYGQVHPPLWEILDEFSGMMDALALSTYPYLAFETAGEIPEDYYSQATEIWDGDIIIAEAGYTSEPVEGRAVIGTQEDQAAFARRLLEEAEQGLYSLVTWYAAFDPEFAGGLTGQFSHIGLKLTDGAPKLAWDLWEEASRRPLDR